MSRLLPPLAAALLALPLLSQGRTDYFNVETPPVKPIAVARVGGHDYLLVCNTPDNSVEIYDTDESADPRLLQRVAVGLEPCSVVWNAAHQRFYTTDFLSDSVTSVRLTAPTGPSSLTHFVLAAQNVVDEPMHGAFTSDDSVLIVTSHTESSITFLDPVTLDQVIPNLTGISTPSITLSDGGMQTMKEARAVAVQGEYLFVAAAKGGKGTGLPLPGFQDFDFDLYVRHLPSGVETAITDLGTMNANMVFSSDGDLFVVSRLARNELQGGPLVTSTLTGFVESYLHWIPGAANGMTMVRSRDLNLLAPGQAVAFDDALANPADVVVFEPGAGPAKVFVAAMGSDRIGIFERDPAQPIDQWAVRRVDVTPPGAPPSDMRAPRGMAVKYANPGQQGDPGDRLYVLNRIRNSIWVMDPNIESFVQEIQMRDPRPTYISRGQPFLYSTRLSGGGFVSCESCHTDGRTDGLQWNLGAPGAFTSPFDLLFTDGPRAGTAADVRWLLRFGFEGDKGPLVTQSLQGLLNYEVEPDIYPLVTNQPHHWRGDRDDFLAFNEAFSQLQGMPEIGTSEQPRGISVAEMIEYREFTHSMQYPPNPQQQLDRKFSGEFGDPALANDSAVGTEAQRGMKLFHVEDTLDGRSCVQCHQLPEGSNNKFTVAFNFEPRDPLETAALRGLFQKESRLDANDGKVSPIVTGNFGTLHDGSHRTINNFITSRFTAFMTNDELELISKFVHELDWGIAPMVGQLEMVIGQASALQTARIDDFEDQVKLANAGLAVRATLDNYATERAFYFDPTIDQYVEEDAPGQTLDRTALMALLVDIRDRLLFVSTPLGSDRRVAALTGVPFTPPPSGITSGRFRPMVTSTPYENVPLFTRNWTPGPLPDFGWTHPELPTPLSLRSQRLMQYGLIQDGQARYGITELRHDAPRRFRVAAYGVQPGAHLIVHTPNDPAAPVPDPNGPLSQMITTAIELPIYPTDDTFNGRPIWETAVEIESNLYLKMMNGGDYAPGVQVALTDWAGNQVTEPPPSGTFDPHGYNWHYVEIQNPGQAPVSLGWRRLSVE